MRWLWQGRIALGKLSEIEGEGGSGKSTLLVWLAAGTSRGELEGDLWGQPATVIIFSAEDGVSDTIRPRLEAQGADLDHVLTTDEDLADRTISLPADLEELRSLIVRTQAKLVIFDPISSFLGSNVNMTSDSSLRRVLGPLKDIAEDTGAAIVLLRHLNAQRNAPANRRGLGGAALTNFVRSVWVLALHPDDGGDPNGRRVLARVKSNLDGCITTSIELRRDVSGRLVIGEELAISADELLLARPRRRASRAPSLQDAIVWLREFLANREVSTVEVEEAAARQDISQRTLERARAELGVLHRRVSIQNANGSSTHQTLLRLFSVEPGQEPAPPMASPIAGLASSLPITVIAADEQLARVASSPTSHSQEEHGDDTSARFLPIELDGVAGADGVGGVGGVDNSASGSDNSTSRPTPPHRVSVQSDNGYDDASIRFSLMELDGAVDGVGGTGGVGGAGNSASKSDNSAVQPTPPSNAETEPGDDR